MRIVFFGSDDFAEVNLRKLIDSPHEIAACVAPPDRPQGRGLKTAPSPIKLCAQQFKIPLFQPTRIDEEGFLRNIKALKTDLFVVISYGLILPKSFLSIPKRMAVNVHPSLLPKYRGAAPINWAVINGETQTGVCVIKMSPRMDAGDIIASEEVEILESDTAELLRIKLAGIAAHLLAATVDALEAGTFSLTPQDESAATYAPKLTKEMGRVEWDAPAVKIHNMVRGLQPWPGAFTYFRGKRLKLTKTRVIEEQHAKASPGEVIEIRADGILTATGDGSLLIEQVHPESGKVMTAADFAAGREISRGSAFNV